jgi:hypothetical protein
MIDLARIEAAARADWDSSGMFPAFDQMDEMMQGWACERVRRVLEAAFPEFIPEIFDGLPHAWVAPWEATQTMAFACGTVTPSEAGRVWQTMRDAHLRGEAS